MLARAAQLLRGCGESFLLVRVRVLNSVGLVWCGRGEQEKARVHLEEAHLICSSALQQVVHAYIHIHTHLHTHTHKCIHTHAQTHTHT